MKHLILLHGWATDSRIWEYQRDLAPGLSTCWTPDLPVWEAGWLWHRLQGLAPDQTVLVGWSLGAMLALEVCARGYAPAVLVLMAGCASFCRRPDYQLGWPAAVVRGMRQQLRTKPEQVVQEFQRQLLSPGEAAAQERLAALLPPRQDPLWLAAGLDYLQHTDLRSRLPQVAAGTIVVIHGSQDRIAAPAQGYFLAEQLSASQLVLLADAGHVPMVSRWQEVNELLAGFLG